MALAGPRARAAMHVVMTSSYRKWHGNAIKSAIQYPKFSAINSGFKLNKIKVDVAEVDVASLVVI